MNELKDIPEYEGKYAITSDGKIWSYVRNKWLSPSLRNGYKSVVLYMGITYRQCYNISQLVAAAWLNVKLHTPNIHIHHKYGLKDTVDNLKPEFVSEHIRNHNFNRGVGNKLDTEIYKVCRKCKILKLKSDFNTSNQAYDGLQNRCKECTRLYQRQYYKRRKK